MPKSHRTYFLLHGLLWRFRSLTAKNFSNTPGKPFRAFTVDNLRACFMALDGTKAPGVDGITKAMYGQHLEEHLHTLHTKLHHMSYRPHPVRRVEIPKEDGTTRPLGVSCTEDKIVQEMARRILEAIYEPVFLETSYGFRPGRSCHDVLRRFNGGGMGEPFNWIVDLDLAQFFDTMPHQEILAVLAQRITDVKFLWLIGPVRTTLSPPERYIYNTLCISSFQAASKWRRFCISSSNVPYGLMWA